MARGVVSGALPLMLFLIRDLVIVLSRFHKFVSSSLVRIFNVDPQA